MKLNITLLYAFIIIFIIAYPSHLKAQNQIFGLAGYMIHGDVAVAEGDLNFESAVSYGLGFNIQVEKYMQAEISWTMSNSNLELTEYLGYTETLTALTIHHFQGGALVEPQQGDKVSPFGLITMGATMFYPTESNFDEEWRFSIALGGGFKVYLSDRVGFRFQGRLIVPMQFTGGTVWFGSGGTGGVSVGTWTAFAEGDFSGGLFIRI